MTLCDKDETSDINVSDVLCWAISETWVEIRRDIPLWAVRGRRFERQSRVWRDVHAQGSSHMLMSDTKELLEPESQSLEHHYSPRQRENRLMPETSNESETLQPIEDRCRELDTHDLALSTFREEQERELDPEAERECEIQLPPGESPMKHELHPDLLSFVATGTIKPDSNAYVPAFMTLKNTSAAPFLDVSQFPSDLLVTKDFATTVKESPGLRFTAEAFQRPVRWILTSSKRMSHTGKRVVTNMIIISPFEAERVIDHVKQSNTTTLHDYTPRQNKSIPRFDRLTLYNVSQSPSEVEVPDTLRIMLNLFGGQRYLESYSEYQYLCELLGVASAKTPKGVVVAPDGFILQGCDNSRTPFRQSPLKFLKVLLSNIQNDCHEIDKTHLGRIVDGRLLQPSDFEDILHIDDSHGLSWELPSWMSKIGSCFFPDVIDG